MRDGGTLVGCPVFGGGVTDRVGGVRWGPPQGLASQEEPSFGEQEAEGRH